MHHEWTLLVYVSIIQLPLVKSQPSGNCAKIILNKTSESRWRFTNFTFSGHWNFLDLLYFLPSKQADVLWKVTETYAPDLNQHELEALGRDPFLIAYALAKKDDRVVVTAEGQGNQKRQNRKIPDVCKDLEVKCYDQWDFGRALNFRAWDSGRFHDLQDDGVAIPESGSVRVHCASEIMLRLR